MIELTPVSMDSHKDKKWKLRTDYKHGEGLTSIPVLLAELHKVVPHYVIGFVKNNLGQFYPAAILTIDGETNLYLSEKSNWLCSYVPAMLRGHPFYLKDGPSKQRYLHIETKSVSELDCDQDFFDQYGKLTKPVSDLMEFLVGVEREFHLTIDASNELAKKNLLEPWDISISVESETIKIAGLHRVNEENLKHIDSDALSTLFEIDAIKLAHAQIFSGHQVHLLAERQKMSQRDSKEINDSEQFELSRNNDLLNFDSFQH